MAVAGCCVAVTVVVLAVAVVGLVVVVVAVAGCCVAVTVVVLAVAVVGLVVGVVTGCWFVVRRCATAGIVLGSLNPVVHPILDRLSVMRNRSTVLDIVYTRDLSL